MICIWCGTKGGFVNRLMISPLEDRSEALSECEFCAGAIDTNLMRWIIKEQREGNL
jgi:hypothetical protein